MQIFGKLLLSFALAVTLSAPALAEEKQSPSSSENKVLDHIDIADQELEKGNYQKAIDEYDLALKSNAKNPRTWAGRALAWAYLEKYPQSIKDYNRSIHLDAKNAGVMYGRGAVYVRMSEHKKAIKDFDRALRMNPKMPDGLYSRAGEYDALRKYDKAIADYDETIKVDPNYFGAYYDRALTFSNMRENKKAVEEYEKALKLDTEKKADRYYVLGVLYTRNGEYEKAVTAFDKVLRDDPKDANAYMGRGAASFCLGNASSASDDFASFLKLSAKDDSNKGYVTITRIISLKQVNEKRYQDALAAALKSLDSNAWPYPILEYLDGKKTSSKVLAKANAPEKRIAAECYIGLNKLLLGQPDGVEHLDWVVTKGNPRYTEHQIATSAKARSSDILLSVLFKAIYKNDLAKVKEVLANGVDCRKCDSQDNCALISAAIHENPEMVSLFLDHGADPNQRLSDGRTALYFAAMSPMRGPLDGELGKIALATNAEIIGILIRRGADVNAKDRFGITPLMNAAKTSNVTALKILLENKADVTASVTSTKVDPAGGHTIAEKGDTAEALAAKNLKYASKTETAPINEIMGLLEQAKKR